MKLDRVIAVRNKKTIYRDDDKCIKVFHKDFTKADVLNEALNHARIELTGINVPKILEVTTVDGKWAIISEYISGKTMAQLINENPDKKDEYLELLVDLQIDINKHSCTLLNNLKDRMNLHICQSGLNATTRYDLHARLNAMPKHTKICHGDFTPSNIIISDDGIPYILDWSHATQGNASADAARTFLLMLINGDKEGAEKYLNLFCEKSDTAKQYVQKWLSLVAASQLVKGNENERELLLPWVNIVDFE